MIDPHQLSQFLFKELHRHPTVSFIHHSMFAMLMAVYLWSQIPFWQFTIWLALVFFGGIWQWILSQRYIKQVSTTVKANHLSQFTMASLTAGLGFGMTALLLPYLPFETRLFVVLMLSAVAASELLKLSAYPSIYAAFLFGLTVPLLLVLSFIDDSHIDLKIIPMIALMVIVLYYSAIQRRRDLTDDLISRFGLENEVGEDQLTQIANRRRFDMTFEQTWAQARRSQFPISLVMIDIDFFKQFNDHYGHPAGDKCLQDVARALANSALRATDLVARYGGEEFVVLLNQTTRDDAFKIAESMRKNVEALKIEHIAAATGYVTISMGGVTVLPTHYKGTTPPLKLADKALYKSKESGRNRVTWHKVEDNAD